jgi:hypothetical protein
MVAETLPFFMSLWSEIANDGDEILEVFGRPATFRGSPITILLDNNPLEQALSDGGFVYRSGFKVRVLVRAGEALYATPPTQGEIFTIFGREYSITTITHRPPSPWIDCQVISTTQ